VQVQVKYRLASGAAVVQHGAVAGGQFALPGKFRGDELQLAQHGRVFRGGFRQRDDMLPWADEDVARRLGLNILESKNISVLVYEFLWDFFFSDFAEQAVVHEDSLQLAVYTARSKS
jgi:hypothetical protein